MTKEQELQDQLTQAQATIEQVKKELNELESKPFKRWRANYGGKYFYNFNGSVKESWELSRTYDNMQYEAGDYYKTGEEAENSRHSYKVQAATQRIIDIIAQERGDWRPDWSDGDQPKGYIYWCHCDNKLDFNYVAETQEHPSYMYFPLNAEKAVLKRVNRDDFKLINGVK